jgi:hypothetical protein
MTEVDNSLRSIIFINWTEISEDEHTPVEKQCSAVKLCPVKSTSVTTKIVEFG